MSDKHTAQSLGKYLGKKVWVKPSVGVSYVGLLNEINFRDLEISVVDTEDETLYRLNGAWIRWVYPILKTVEDLTDCIKYRLYCDIVEYVYKGAMYCYGSSEYYGDLHNDFTITSDAHNCSLLPEHMVRLLEKNCGSIPDKDSPTGYVSIHDGLPCKRWSDVFND